MNIIISDLLTYTLCIKPYLNTYTRRHLLPHLSSSTTTTTKKERLILKSDEDSVNTNNYNILNKKINFNLMKKYILPAVYWLESILSVI